MNIPLSPIQDALRRAGLDGWLLYDFHGVNPITRHLLGVEGMATRRLFVVIPAEGEPVAIAHKIELHTINGFPGLIVPYAAWQELDAALEKAVGGKTLAMEISPEDAVPYLDRVPLGVVQLLERFGATVVPSDELVTQFAASWSDDDIDQHRDAAEALARIARETFTATGNALRSGQEVRCS